MEAPGHGPGQGPEQDNNTTGPKIIRPIPRRPFSLALKSPTPPEDDSAPGTPNLQQQKITAHDLRFLAVHNGGFGFGNGNSNQYNRDRERDKDSHSASSSISRAASLMNLTSSTLFGIYSPASPTEPESRRDSFDPRDGGLGGGGGLGGLGVMMGGADDQSSTPWGTGAETPARRRPGLDEETYKLMKSRSSGVASSGLAYRAPATSGVAAGIESGEPAEGGSVVVIASLLVRGMLLFGLGMGYGVLVTRLPTKARHHQHHFTGEHHDLEGMSNTTSTDLNWGYLAFWGCAGVALGCLLPWFDQVWEDTFGKRRKAKADEKQKKEKAKANGAAWKEKVSPKSSPLQNQLDQQDDDDYFPPPSPPQTQGQGQGQVTGQQQEGPSSQAAARAETDWALVIRGIGAFVGIVFAIRRLPWTSTMQVSLSLALVNPFLWYLVDRSKPGFLLSAAVGVFGSLSVLFLGVGGFAGGVLPAPFSSTGGASLDMADGWGDQSGGVNGSSAQAAQQLMNKTFGLVGLGGRLEGWFASQENIEAGVWILSVLFCSCVCFGNIGRRLALNRSAAARGRWGGVR